MMSWIRNRLLAIRDSRNPDFVIGGNAKPYMLRWFVIPRNRIFNIYLHVFLRSDDDRALHDHPWPNISYLVEGSYTEHTIAAGGVHHRQILEAGAIRIRPNPKFAHRVELHAGECTTLFITGPKVRTWGFHCDHKGWVPWKEFTRPGATGEIGRGCD